MSTITVNENQLEEVVSKVVQQHLKLTFQDMEEVRRSPAGAIVRLETKIESLADAVGELKAEIANSRAESKEEYEKLRAEIANFRAETKAVFEKTQEKLGKLEEAQIDLNARLTKVEGMLKLIVALYFALFGIVASWFAKSVFFP